MPGVPSLGLNIYTYITGEVFDKQLGSDSGKCFEQSLKLLSKQRGLDSKQFCQF